MKDFSQNLRCDHFWKNSKIQIKFPHSHSDERFLPKPQMGSLKGIFLKPLSGTFEDLQGENVLDCFEIPNTSEKSQKVFSSEVLKKYLKIISKMFSSQKSLKNLSTEVPKISQKMWKVFLPEVQKYLKIISKLSSQMYLKKSQKSLHRGLKKS